jgi:hypothetical protein
MTITLNGSTGINTPADTVTGNVTIGGTLAVTGATTVGGTSVVAVAPGTNGNILTSNGSAWTSAAPAGGGVTSAVAGNGITVSAATGAVTISQDFYTGTNAANTSYPISSYILVDGTTRTIAASSTIYIDGNDNTRFGAAGSTSLTGTWRSRGTLYSDGRNGVVFQRTA